MKKLFNILFSPKMTLVLLFIFGAAIGTATFIEEKYDTVTARLLVYDTKWMELVLLLLVLNFIGIIRRYNLFRKEKAATLLFHLAFILIIVGAGITRYLSFDGSMHIREGSSSDVIYTSTPYLQVRATGMDLDYTYEKETYFNEAVKNSFHLAIHTKAHQEILVNYDDFMQNAVEKVDENQPGGKDILEFVVSAGQGRETVLLEEGGSQEAGGVVFAYNKAVSSDAVVFTKETGRLLLHSSTEIIPKMMHGAGMEADTAGNTHPGDTVREIRPEVLYQTNGVYILFIREFISAKKTLVRGKPEDKGSEVLLVDVTINGKKQEVPVYIGLGSPAEFTEVNQDGIRLMIGYGNKEIRLPFSLHLDDFILDRYAGSMSPSSYASEVTLSDQRKNLVEKHRIYMNHVLDYGGFRFFQSSYDIDEKGTILSVNHDFWGTWVSYSGYILLGIGFVLTLFNPNSRFRQLLRNIGEVRLRRKAGIAMGLLLFFGLNGSVFSQNGVRKPVGRDHAEKFGHLVVQTYDGRFEPMHTLVTDVMHKISRKDKFKTDVKGELTGMQVFLDMLMDPEYWKNQKIIYVREKSVQDVVGADGKYAAFYDFLDKNSGYKLSAYAEQAFRKRQGAQNTFDKEIIKVDERLNILMSVMSGSLLKVFPIEGSSNHKWISFVDTLARIPMSEKMKALAGDLPLNALDYNNLMRYYLQTVFDATQSGDYSTADMVLSKISEVQRQGTPSSLLPSPSMINTEIYYNKSEIFILLKNVYGLLSIILLALAFTDNLRTRKSRFVTWALYFFIVILGFAFLYHTYGMGLRWYLTGHAPWSNGYEALLLIAWGSLLAGFSFARYSKITLAATVVLAFSVLMTAGHSSYDPQLTNLQPVLKSYWLIIHVAVITLSYGFLALGFILGIINLVLFLFRSSDGKSRLNLIIEELTYTNEMALIVGVTLATLGTFLGGVWANESWGRYWGWDAKETWALVIVITYALILHMRFVPGLKNRIVFNAASVIGFGSVVMTFVGVNYYLSKGLHSYAADEKTVFPLWAWGMILSLLLLIAAAVTKHISQTRANKGGGLG